MSKYQEKFPSQEFAETVDKDGLEWLWTEWKIPKMKISFNSTIKKAKSYLEEVIKLNPELSVIKAETVVEIVQIYAGVLSKFNLEDIKFFTENHTNIEDYNFHENFDNWIEIQKIAKFDIGWIMSPITVEKLKKQLSCIEQKRKDIEYTEVEFEFIKLEK